MRGALLRYRVMAYLVGTGLIILVFVGIPLQYGASKPGVVMVVGPIHGALYIVYLLAAIDLARRGRFTLLQMAAMIGAGFLPFLAFFIERRVTRRVEQEFPAPATPAAGEPPG
jgi:integral membrane protein